MNAQEIAEALGGRRNGAGWKCLCPAHDDRNPSLSIDIGENGKPLVRCFAGCDQDAVISALKDRGLWPEAGGFNGSNGAPRPDPWCVITPVPQDAPRELPSHRLGKPSVKWAYRNQAGELLFVVCRFDRSDGGKEVLPLTYGDDGRGARWNWKAYPVPRPLYGLPEMAANVVNTVLVVEGEKVADAAR